MVFKLVLVCKAIGDFNHADEKFNRISNLNIRRKVPQKAELVDVISPLPAYS